VAILQAFGGREEGQEGQQRTAKQFLVRRESNCSLGEAVEKAS
jgi:hypothetical protein